MRRVTFAAIRVASRCARPADNGSSKQEIKWSTFAIVFLSFFVLIRTNSFFGDHSSSPFAAHSLELV